MSKQYLLSLNYTYFVCRAVEMPLPLPGCILRWRLLNPMACATQGSVDAACMALKHGWAINLGGGYHHATRTSGGGFCIYPDITFVTHYLEKWFNLQKFCIIDLDAHQGNGHERDHYNFAKYYIIDAYNHYIYPGDAKARQSISEDLRITDSTSDADFRGMVTRSLRKCFSEFKPDFVIYNAGTDCLAGDPLGNLNISEQGIIDRDQTVFEECFNAKVPVLMILSGGYQKSNAPVIARSIQNLDNQFGVIKNFKN
jgi:histone deacetylase 11